ncbi:N-6 DNA methylase [Vibrio harveyi]|uniref:N-6 DNA methylase n=1 Tax=Vibrio harveyi TaxID=669 RepID=UPI00237FBB11|nr:N-6 DNA methylase [Vibrio harveyi]HDM8069026.1 N-6 DNA methylase [Vibrio harveyi]
MKKLLKTIEAKANYHQITVQRMFEIFVEIQYLYVIAGVSESKYYDYAQAFNEITESYLNEVRRKPFSDVLGELMAHINLLKNGKRDKHCQHFTPSHISDAVSQMMETKPDQLEKTYVCDIACGSGALALSKLKDFKKKGQTKEISIVLNDLDLFICKVATIQLECNNFLHINYPISYVIYNHDALLEYEEFAVNGLTEKTKIVGCDTPALITDELVQRALGSPERIESVLQMRSLHSIMALNHYLSESDVANDVVELQEAV